MTAFAQLIIDRTSLARIVIFNFLNNIMGNLFIDTHHYTHQLKYQYHTQRN